jgi:hypothetical protein
MNQISITYAHFPDAEIFTATARGLTHQQFRHYALPCGFLEFQDEVSRPLLLGSSRDQKSALRTMLETAGFEITGVEFVCALERWRASQ